jgi:hypothetical protein
MIGGVVLSLSISIGLPSETAHADLPAQRFGRANSHYAHDIEVENGLGGAIGIFYGDLAMNSGC